MKPNTDRRKTSANVKILYTYLSSNDVIHQKDHYACKQVTSSASDLQAPPKLLCFYAKVPLMAATNFGHFGLLRRKFSLQTVFRIKFGMKLILNLQSNIQEY